MNPGHMVHEVFRPIYQVTWMSGDLPERFTFEAHGLMFTHGAILLAVAATVLQARANHVVVGHTGDGECDLPGSCTN